jgi:acetyl-CoA carboxylase biotin carboxyl carrier protein
MTTSDTTTRLHLPEPFDAVKPAESAAVLNSVRDSALGLLAGLDRAPQSLRIRTEGVEIELEWPEPGQPAAAAAGALADAAAVPVTPAEMLSPLAGTEQFITSQVVGMFYRSREPGAEPFVQPGDVVRPGQQVGIIEAMKLMIPVEADLDGQVLDVLVADGTPVEYGDRLFAVEPAAY